MLGVTVEITIAALMIWLNNSTKTSTSTSTSTNRIATGIGKIIAKLTMLVVALLSPSSITMTTEDVAIEIACVLLMLLLLLFMPLCFFVQHSQQLPIPTRLLVSVVCATTHAQ